jgi:hypothetical protein
VVLHGDVTSPAVAFLHLQGFAEHRGANRNGSCLMNVRKGWQLTPGTGGSFWWRLNLGITSCMSHIKTHR